MANADLVVKVRADASGVAQGLRPLTSSLQGVSKEADKTQAALDGVGKTKVTPTVNAQAVQRAREEIRRLQDQIARDIAVGADTRPAQRRIGELNSAIKKLEQQPHEVEVRADTRQAEGAVSRLRASLGGLEDVDLDLGGGAGFSQLASGLTKIGTGGAAAATGIGALVVAATSMEKAMLTAAADVETFKLQFQGLTGSAEGAEQIFRQLKTFADQTPFEFPELAEAAKNLLAFGVAAEDVPATLKNLGEASANTGAALTDLTMIYGQMLAKGKIATEELLQFQERGIPATRLLAEALGKTEAEISEMVAAGKLGRKEIELLGKAIGDANVGALARQAASFNGQMSTLSDGINSISAGLGQTLLPLMTDLVSAANDVVGPLASIAGKLGEIGASEGVQAIIKTVSGLGVLTTGLHNLGSALDWVAEKMGATGDEAEETGDQAAGAGDDVAGMGADFDTLTKSLEKANSELDKAVGAFEKLLGVGQTVPAALDDFAGSVNDLAASLKDNGASFTGNSEKALANRDALREVADSAFEVLGAQADLGASSEDLTGQMGVLRGQFVAAATAAGLSADQANKLADEYGLIPENVTTAIETSGLGSAQAGVASFQAQLDKLPKSKVISIRYDITGTFPMGGPRELSGLPSAAGGPAQPGRTYWVGEKGPEFFLPNVPGYIQARQTTEAIVKANAAASHAPEMNVAVKVFIGERELSDVVRYEVQGENARVARRVAGGVR